MKLRFLNLFFSVLLCCLPVTLQAAGVTIYKLTGSLVTSCEKKGVPSTDSECNIFMGKSFDGLIAIDESLLTSGTLKNQTLQWHLVNMGSGGGVVSTGENIGALDFGLPLPWSHTTVYSDFRLMTDAFGRSTSWRIDILDGPPDYFITNAGLSIYAGDHDWLGVPGKLAIIPIPSTLLLLISGLIMILGFSRLRKFSL